MSCSDKTTPYVYIYAGYVKEIIRKTIPKKNKCPHMRAFKIFYVPLRAKRKNTSQMLKPLTKAEIDAMIDESERQIAAGEVYDAEDVVTDLCEHLGLKT